MVRNTLIVILAALLSVTSYLLYTNRNISINVGGSAAGCDTGAPVESKGENASPGSVDQDTPASAETANPPREASSEDVEKVVRDWGGTMAEPGAEALTVMRLAHRNGGWRWCE
jgi:hypothetical protein